MSLAVQTLPHNRVVELGAGNGVITAALLETIHKKDLTVVEIDKHFAETLSNKFEMKVENKCALQYLREIKERVGVVSSLPLINNREFKNKFLTEVDALYKKGLLKWLITYTYGLDDPLKEVVFLNRKRIKIVFLNIPPACLWLYT